MLTKTEILTSLVSGVGVVGMTVMATTYWAGSGQSNSEASVEAVGATRHSYELSDAFFTCRDQIALSIPYKVRNINIDSHSSRYETGKNTHMVFIDLDVVEKPSSFYSKANYSARVMCQVSAANNEVTSFKITRG